MALFGRRANQQSNMTDVPPELQPYYRQETAGARARRLALTVVPILVVLLLIGGAIWGLVWLNRHKAPTPHPSSNSQTAQNNQPQSPNSSSQGNQNQGGSSSGSNQSGSSPGPSSSTQSQGSSGSSSANTPGSSGAQKPAGGAIPSTGPSAGALTLAAMTTVGGAAAYHVRQVRRVRREG